MQGITVKMPLFFKKNEISIVGFANGKGLQVKRICLTWPLGASLAQPTQPEDDGPLVLGHNLQGEIKTICFFKS